VRGRENGKGVFTGFKMLVAVRYISVIVPAIPEGNLRTYRRVPPPPWENAGKTQFSQLFIQPFSTAVVFFLL